MARPRARHRGRQRRFRRLRQGLRRAAEGNVAACQRAHALCDRVDDQGDDVRVDRHARRRGQARARRSRHEVHPELQLSDPWVTRELTIRDLLTHRSGLPGTDLFWASSWKYSPADVIHRLRYIQPTASFRSEWQYHNVLYALNGLIIERVSGVPWEQFVKKRIFEPLGMNETLALVSMIAGQPNVAVPHALVNDSVTVVPVRSTDPV